jgi:hypothetical protein
MKRAFIAHHFHTFHFGDDNDGYDPSMSPVLRSMGNGPECRCCSIELPVDPAFDAQSSFHLVSFRR